MASNYFHFKRFTIDQQGCAMKVGTDGVLLGAWCKVTQDQRRILDIGSGTGLLSLMIAQRNPYAIIDAVDIDSRAFEQAKINIKNSPWSKQINTYNLSIQDFAQQAKTKYDLIVSNPPYFINSLKAPDDSRQAARHSDLLSQHDLAATAKKLLSEKGSFYVIFPYQEANIFIVEAALNQLYLTSRLDVYPKDGRAIKRIIMEFSHNKQNIVKSDSLIIENDIRGDYTQKYMELTKDFYQKF